MKLNLKLKFNFKKLKFEKHILIIVIIVFITLLISLYLYSIIASAEESVEKSGRELSVLDKKLSAINTYKPSPTQGNIADIEKDTSYIKKQLWLLKAAFGNPYLTPLVHFNKALKNHKSNIQPQDELTDEDYLSLSDFLDSWAAYYKANTPKLQNSETAKTSFLKYLEKNGYTADDYEKALEAFQISLQKNCFDELEPIITEDFLLNSIGFPIRISRIQCKELISRIENNINNKLQEHKIFSATHQIKLFDEFSTMPNDDQIPYIIDYLWFYQYLISKILNNKIESFPLHNKLNGLRGTTEGDFIVLKYEIEVIGSMSSVRSFLDNLQNSSKDNRVYVINFISMEKAVDNAENIEVPEKRKRTLDISIIIGSSDLIKSKIKLSYYIYNKSLVNL